MPAPPEATPPEAAPPGRGGAVPRLLLIADGFASGRPELDAGAIRDRALACVEAGVPWVSLRDHAAPPDAFAEHAEAFAADLRRARPALALSVHGRLDVAQALGAGLHVGRRGASLADAVAAGLDAPVGLSCHSGADAARAGRVANRQTANRRIADRGGGADYVTVSPVWQTRTHPDAEPAGIDLVRLAAEQARVPVLALGGVTPPRARICRIVGAHGAAAAGGLLFAWDAEATTRAFLEAVGHP
ncbi:thiamine phosphate synthase [Rubrivirga litoralis]|uniref:Thiamine phosphate synthase n=1 Tax=Rubrivirga litoralis TaxID=3075598 RepID=A0ABU3BTY7_9BACT|nr:thiamine phosphate synthase [Rubrivirga sp. F394]MDT0632737.1 thiamine phosphate synthase [Rubrivirga sp. F394]